jgi:hypothetical protein
MKDELANSAAVVAARETELKQLTSAIDDMQVIQSALCARVRELTGKHEAGEKRIHELEGQTIENAKTIRDRDQQLAAIQFAALDGARIGNQLGRERRRMEEEAVNGWKGLISTLLQTPLTALQRGVISEITHAVDVWNRSKTEGGLAFQIEPPDLHGAEINCAEFFKDVLTDVRRRADEAGVKIRSTVPSPLPESARGNAQHIHHLVTMLSEALPKAASVDTIEIELSYHGLPSDDGQLMISYLLASDSADALSVKLQRLVDTRDSSEASSCADAVVALKAGWQLAFALGGVPSIQATEDRKVRVQISLPLTTAAVSSSEV